MCVFKYIFKEEEDMDLTGEGDTRGGRKRRWRAGNYETKGDIYETLEELNNDQSSLGQ